MSAKKKINRGGAEARRIEPFDESFSIGRGHSNITHQKESFGEWDYGPVATPNGFVIVQAQSDNTIFTSLRFVYGGRMFIRTWQRYFSRKHQSALAKKFSAEIVSGSLRLRASAVKKS